jgi:hypothetical protein
MTAILDRLYQGGQGMGSTEHVAKAPERPEDNESWARARILARDLIVEDKSSAEAFRLSFATIELLQATIFHLNLIDSPYDERLSACSAFLEMELSRPGYVLEQLSMFQDDRVKAISALTREQGASWVRGGTVRNLIVMTALLNLPNHPEIGLA